MKWDVSTIAKALDGNKKLNGGLPLLPFIFPAKIVILIVQDMISPGEANCGYDECQKKQPRLTFQLELPKLQSGDSKQ